MATLVFSRNHLIAQVSKFGDVIYQWNTPTESLLFEGKQIVLEGFLIKTKGAIRSKKKVRLILDYCD